MYYVIYDFNLPPVLICFGICLGIYIISRVEQAVRKAVFFVRGVVS